MAKSNLFGKRLQPLRDFWLSIPSQHAPGVQGSSRPDDYCAVHACEDPSSPLCLGEPFPGEEVLLCSPLSCPVPLHAIAFPSRALPYLCQ